MQNYTIKNFKLVEGHRYLRALTDIELGPFELKGMRLEERENNVLTLGFPGRKIQGRWQLVYRTRNLFFQEQVLEDLTTRYRELAA